ncbi:hypothetical protein SRHO_G00271630 [Serrasalmus rhombeus]
MFRAECHFPQAYTEWSKQVKKPRRAEVNYCPDYPVGHTKESLEQKRLSLLSEVKKKNKQQVVKEKMERTFAYRRHEVIEDKPFMADFKERWPALFSECEVEAEFARITTVPLISKFMQQLDHHSSQLIKEKEELLDKKLGMQTRMTPLKQKELAY